MCLIFPPKKKKVMCLISPKKKKNYVPNNNTFTISTKVEKKASGSFLLNQILNLRL